jgi:isochorismate synthase EntC
VKPASIDAIAANIATARKFHGMNEYAAAAVHARVAFELSLKKLCERKSIPVRFKADPRELNTEDLLSAIENWLNAPKGTQFKQHVEQAIKDVKQARKVVLNQFSHSTPVNLADIEVKSAIDAVEKLHADFQQHIPR